jgi:hypothetical protein
MEAIAVAQSNAANRFIESLLNSGVGPFGKLGAESHGVHGKAEQLDAATNRALLAWNDRFDAISGV